MSGTPPKTKPSPSPSPSQSHTPLLLADIHTSITEIERNIALNAGGPAYNLPQSASPLPHPHPLSFSSPGTSINANSNSNSNRERERVSREGKDRDRASQCQRTRDSLLHETLQLQFQYDQNLVYGDYGEGGLKLKEGGGGGKSGFLGRLGRVLLGGGGGEGGEKEKEMGRNLSVYGEVEIESITLNELPEFSVRTLNYSRDRAPLNFTALPTQSVY
ncbi:hypothetical protein DFH27DRAFT_632664 [Peziza echinospora]|nr:hypothetical protein DFH27DRAFT_632664 [Peziza echinospora]